jgi:hypothetical protein
VVIRYIVTELCRMCRENNPCPARRGRRVGTYPIHQRNENEAITDRQEKSKSGGRETREQKKMKLKNRLEKKKVQRAVQCATIGSGICWGRRLQLADALLPETPHEPPLEVGVIYESISTSSSGIFTCL